MVVPAAPALKTVAAVELSAIGQWRAGTGTTTFTENDFRDAVGALTCPAVRRPVLKLGHDEPDSAGIRWDGEPTVGWVDNMAYQEDTGKIVGDYVGMPAWLADILTSAYPDRSIEIARPYLCAVGHLHPAVITAVALLGVMPPAVGVIKSLQDVAAIYGVTTAALRRIALIRR